MYMGLRIGEVLALSKESIDLENNTYKNIQKISDSELIQLWEIYLKDKSNKSTKVHGMR